MACPGFFVEKKPVTSPENIDCNKDSDDIDCNFLFHNITNSRQRYKILHTYYKMRKLIGIFFNLNRSCAGSCPEDNNNTVVNANKIKIIRFILWTYFAK
ncbi:hypothetical protein FACS189432_07490 [Bacteroidia bacterium]|nr:hypothetical protein FACS189432_07490 [Bacteroidia bacterium]GHT84724.1 hypothetical protein FACS18947_2560 [Bacteroidia bacterium]